MAFDVYVGSLTRFYRREWENVVQRDAREQGLEYRMIYAGGEPPPPPDAAVLQQAVNHWREALSNGLREVLSEPLRWNESVEAPYFTDRPGWEGYRGALLWAAYDEHPEMARPRLLPNEWHGDAAYEQSVAYASESKYGHLLTPSLWLPADFDVTFDAPTLSADKDRIGSTFALQRQMQALQQTIDREPPESFSTTMAAPAASAPRARASLFSRMFRGPQPAAPRQSCEPELLSIAAREGIRVFAELSRQACEHRLPMLLSF
jgi:hypothetical protein